MDKENVRNSIRPNFIRILSADPENRTTGINQDLRESLIVSCLNCSPKPKKEVQYALRGRGMLVRTCSNDLQDRIIRRCIRGRVRTK